MWTRQGSDLSLDGTARALSLKTLLAIALIALGCSMFAARAQATAVPETISYPSFSAGDESGLQLNGSATFTSSSLQLTPALDDQSGAAFSRTQIQSAGSFETEFELRMHDSNTLTDFGFPADGIAFVLQPKSDEEVGESGGDLGYAGISPSAVVQFDIYPNPYDPYYSPEKYENRERTPYISFMENGNAEEHLQNSEVLPWLYEEPVWAWIDYNATTHMLAVYASQTASKPAQPLFEHSVNLVELLGSQYTFAGFTAGTGEGDAVQEILSWQLHSTGETSVEVKSNPSTTAHGSSTSVSCNLIVATASDTCTATVTDVDVPAAITPTGQVSFSSASGGVFSDGNTCNLAATPGSPDAASCSVQFLPPSGASTAPAITATYGGDPHHGGSSGHTFYASAAELSGDIEFSSNATTSENGSTVTISVDCGFPCSTTGTLSGPDDEPGAGMASFSGLGGDAAVIAKAKKPGKKKRTAKPIVFGAGSLTLSKPGNGTLVIKLNGKAKLAFKKAKGKPFKAVLEVTVKTANGTLVKTEKLTVTIRPAKKKPKKSGKHGK
jgi:Bacterial lectin